MDAKEQALADLKAAVAEAGEAARGHLAAGAHPDAVGLGLARMSDGLDPAVQAALVGALVGKQKGPADAAAVAQAAVAGLSDDRSKASVVSAVLSGVNPASLSAEQLSALKQLVAAAEAGAKPNPPS